MTREEVGKKGENGPDPAPEEHEDASMSALLKRSLGAKQVPPPKGFVRGVQKRIRVRSRGKFYADGWSVSSSRVNYMFVAGVMLILSWRSRVLRARADGDHRYVESDHRTLAGLGVAIASPPTGSASQDGSGRRALSAAAQRTPKPAKVNVAPTPIRFAKTPPIPEPSDHADKNASW